jgi:hypothetical protein
MHYHTTAPGGLHKNKQSRLEASRTSCKQEWHAVIPPASLPHGWAGAEAVLVLTIRRPSTTVEGNEQVQSGASIRSNLTSARSGKFPERSVA